uniref:Protein painting of fourth n=1 Tax=Culex pipiens TaxID=7175 RepID=A0A8D8E3A5_CULPI
MQYRSSVSSRSSLFPSQSQSQQHYRGSGAAGAHSQQRAKPALPRLGKSDDSFNVDSGLETSEFDFVDFAEDVFNCREVPPPKLIQEAAALFGLVAGTANRRPPNTRHRPRTLIEPQQPKRTQHPLLTGKYHRRRNRSRVSFDFDPPSSSPSHHDLVDLQSTEDQRRQRSHPRASPTTKRQPIPVKPPTVPAPPPTPQHKAQLPAPPPPPPPPQRMMNWTRSDAARALQAEAQAVELLKSPHVLVLRFPDPELNKDIIQGYSPSIETVIFHRPSTPRYCLVHLKPDADVDRVIEQLSKISFGTGKITVERKTKNVEPKPVMQPEEIDPVTLFIGNLPNAVTVFTVKQMFPTAKRIDIGHAQRMKHTRYAFIRFHCVTDAIGAFRANFNKVIDGKNIILRFRRFNAPIALPEDTATPKTPKRRHGQLFVSVEQKPNRAAIVGGCIQVPKHDIHHSDTLNTIKTEILDEDTVRPAGIGVRPKVKAEPPEIPSVGPEDELEESDDDIEDFLEDDAGGNVNLDEINTDAAYCEDDDTDIAAFDKNYWTLEQLRCKVNNNDADDASSSISEPKECDVFMELETGTKTSSTTYTTDTKDHKPAAFIMSKRRDDQMQDLFSNLEPDDDLSL